MVEIGVLGPVRVEEPDGQPIRLGGVKPRAVLAYLAVNAGRVVSTDSLIEAVWGDSAPTTAANTLQATVSALRRALKPHGIAVTRDGPGYRLDVPASSVDQHRFEALAAEGRAALRGGDAPRAEHLLTTAVSLWRGEAFQDLDGVPFVAWVRPALDNVRKSASVERIESMIELERFDEAAVEAERLVARSPFDERAWAVTMTGYYWAGRQSDALEAYQRARSILAEELGIDPGPELVALERSMLEHTVPRPGRTTDADDMPSDPDPVLPPGRPLVGRDHLTEKVAEEVASGARLVSLVGLGGIGKTSLAVAVGHRLDANGSAVWFVDCSSATQADAVAEAIARTIGAEAADGPVEAVAGWVATRDAVLILDNLEQVTDAAEFVRSLLDRGGAIRLLVTSRRALRLRDEHVVPIPPLPVRSLEGDGDAAVELLRRRAHQVRSDLVELDTDVVVEICEFAAGIPLGIELAALQLRALSPPQLLDRLRRTSLTALDAPGTDDYPERQHSLRAVLDATLGSLAPQAREVLSLLALVEGPSTVDLIDRTGVAGAGGAVAAIADLVEAGVVARLDDGRLWVPIPIRQYVVDRLDPRTRSGVERELLAAVHDLAEAAAEHWYGPDAGEHRRRLREEQAAVDAAVAAGSRAGNDEHVARLALLLAPCWLQESRLREALVILDRLHAADLPPELAWRVRLLAGSFASYVNREDTAELLAPALGDPPDPSTPPDRLVVNAWCCLGAFHANRQDVDEVRRCVEAARQTAAASGDPQLVALARDFAGYAASYLGDTDTAIRLTLEAVDDARRQGDTHALALLLATVAEAMLQSDRADEAGILAAEAFDLARRVDLGIALTWVLLMVGATQIELGRPAAGWGSLVEHLRFTRERYPDPLSIGDSLSHLAAAEALLGDPETAARMWGASAAIQSDHGVDPERRRLATNQRHLDAARARIGPARFDALVLAGSVAPEAVIDAILERPERTPVAVATATPSGK